ncbi:MAG: four helix bundle protein [Ferruginibacter sp.]
MPTIKTFEELDIWQKAQSLAADIYLLTETNQKIKRDFSFKDQIKRAALSISSNIAEGFEYSNNKDFIKFLRYSKGSAGEVRNCLLFAVNVNFVSKENAQALVDVSQELGNRIGALIKYLRSRPDKPGTKNP